MAKILYAPRPIRLNTYMVHNEVIGYIVDRVEIKEKKTYYCQNEPQNTYYEAEFQAYSGNFSHCNRLICEILPSEITSSYETCKKIVRQKNKEIAMHERSYYPPERWSEVDADLEEYRQILEEQQKIAKENWANGLNV